MKPESINEPHAQRDKNEKTFLNLPNSSRGWLKNGNPPGDPTKAPRCNARSKRTGNPCRQPAMSNGKCRLHGGKSTGPRTPEGLARSRKARWKHGYCSAEAKEERRQMSAFFRQASALLGRMNQE